MKILVQQQKALNMLDIAAKFVSKNSTLPILQNIYLKASIDSLLIRATDMEKYVEIEIPCEVQIEGAITINAKTFLDILKTIESENIELSVDQKTNIMTIKTPKDTFDINGIAASEYVALPEVPQENSFVLDTLAFSKGIDHVEYAVTEKSFSPVLTGVLMKTGKGDASNKLIFVGTDSFRLSEYRVNHTNASDFSLIMPKALVNDMRTVVNFAIGKEVADMKVNYSENLIAFSFVIEDIKIIATSLLIQGNFPEYEREEVLPTQFVTKVMLDKNECEKAIRKIGILTRDINNFIQIETKDSKVIISSGKTDKGAGITELAAIIDGEPLTFAVNGRYISDFIKNMESDTLVFNIINSQKPVVLMDKDEENNRYVVRPLINN
ncbi:MAG: DNA polymerase III subunit beta [candidate division SR1 bacterium]|nr:DNA polymerase III subunit beta [candidate division SR1 bacterium]RKW25574.1 MAG: DNA polymerase III subunit beta [Candidatus Gracilibacteria bacterium]